jgi:hypothetical protein
MIPKKLTIELVPQTVWYSSLYNIFKEANQYDLWGDIKRTIFKNEGRKCWICGEENRRLEAHEFWEYDDKNHIQKLVAIHHLCDLCHKIKHIGLWLHTSDGERMLEEQGLHPEDIIEHFCRVNNCSEDDFENHEEEAFKIWSNRSEHKWIQDFGPYAKIINPILKVKSK